MKTFFMILMIFAVSLCSFADTNYQALYNQQLAKQHKVSNYIIDSIYSIKVQAYDTADSALKNALYELGTDNQPISLNKNYALFMKQWDEADYSNKDNVLILCASTANDLDISKANDILDKLRTSSNKEKAVFAICANLRSGSSEDIIDIADRLYSSSSRSKALLIAIKNSYLNFKKTDVERFCDYTPYSYIMENLLENAALSLKGLNMNTVDWLIDETRTSSNKYNVILNSVRNLNWDPTMQQIIDLADYANSSTKHDKVLIFGVRHAKDFDDIQKLSDSAKSYSVRKQILSLSGVKSRTNTFHIDNNVVEDLLYTLEHTEK